MKRLYQSLIYHVGIAERCNHNKIHGVQDNEQRRRVKAELTGLNAVVQSLFAYVCFSFLTMILP